MWAYVESYALGYATVRLAQGGARLTNLAVLGAMVKPGDLVIVDYSTGIKPVVRPVSTKPVYQSPTSTLQLATATPPVAAGESYVQAEDIGCQAMSHEYSPGNPHQWFNTGNPYRPLMNGVWTKLYFNRVNWDPTKMAGYSGVTIKVPGFYLVTANWDEGANGFQIMGIKPPAIPVTYKVWEFSGYYALRVKCNGTVILQANNRDFESVDGWGNCSGMMLDYFDAGDVLEMEVFSTVRIDNNYDLAYPNYAYHDFSWVNNLTVHCVLSLA
jgi:hypothetical protein